MPEDEANGKIEDTTEYFYSVAEFDSSRSKNVAVLLDRDGVIIEEKNYLRSPSNIQFVPGSLEAIRQLNASGAFIGVVTNQAGIARGIMTLAEARAVNAEFFVQLQKEKAVIHCLMFCPYHPQGTVSGYIRESRFRKPGIGMFEFIRDFYRLDGFKFFVVGDKESDVAAGEKFGAISILVETGFGKQQSSVVRRHFPHVHIVPKLQDAAQWILKK
jgi:D-glycero-D-manno-heptose 1,7-bisphosphate phosphatase